MKLLSVDRSVCEDVCEWVARRGSPFANLGVPLTPMLARVYGRRDRFFDHREAAVCDAGGRAPTARVTMNGWRFGALGLFSKARQCPRLKP